MQADHAAIHRGERGVQHLLFLCQDYRPECWYWEVVGTTRKLVLTGFVLLIPEERAFVRLVVATLICSFYAVVLAVVQLLPARRPGLAPRFGLRRGRPVPRGGGRAGLPAQPGPAAGPAPRGAGADTSTLIARITTRRCLYLEGSALIRS